MRKRIIYYCFELKRDCIQRKCPYWHVYRKGKWGETEIRYDTIDKCVSSTTKRIFLGNKEEKINIPVERKITTIKTFVYNYSGRCGIFTDQKDSYLGQEKVSLPTEYACEYIELLGGRSLFSDSYYKSHPKAREIESLSEEEISDREYQKLIEQGILATE